MSKKISTFANDNDEPTALAFTDFTKPSPTISGDDAIRFYKNMKMVEEEAEKRKREPVSLEELKEEYSIGMMILEYEKKSIEKSEMKLEKIRNKITELEQKNGKTEEE